MLMLVRHSARFDAAYIHELPRRIDLIETHLVVPPIVEPPQIDRG
jgi:hypothetical protein